VQEPSAEYRKILWSVAFDKTNASPTRFLFGYGGLSTELMDISMYFGRQRGGQVMAQGFSSWDSAWAAQLVQYGWVGLALELILQITIYVKVLNAYKRVQEAEVKSLLAAVLSGCMVFTWGMLTVAMFSPQLVYLFWTLAGAGIITGLDSKGLSKRV
jgi:hypothetical protein